MLCPAGTRNTRLPAPLGQSADDQNVLPLVGVMVNTAFFGPRSTLQSADELFLAVSSKVGVWSGE